MQNIGITLYIAVPRDPLDKTTEFSACPVKSNINSL